MAKQGLASIGIDVKINDVSMNYVTDIGDIGGSPSELDATCMKDTMKKSAFGVKDVKAFEVSYLYDNTDTDSDYRVIKAVEKKGEIVPVTVTFPDKTEFSTTGYVSTMINGVKVDELIGAKMSVSLQSDWTEKNPTT